MLKKNHIKLSGLKQQPYIIPQEYMGWLGSTIDLGYAGPTLLLVLAVVDTYILQSADCWLIWDGLSWSTWLCSMYLILHKDSLVVSSGNCKSSRIVEIFKCCFLSFCLDQVCYWPSDQSKSQVRSSPGLVWDTRDMNTRKYKQSVPWVQSIFH